MKHKTAIKTLEELAEEAQSAQARREQEQLQRANERGAQQFDLVSVLNSHALMRYPMFTSISRSQKQQEEPILYYSSDGSVSVEVKGNYGIPNQADANIFRWAISAARQIRTETGAIPKEISTTRYHLLKVLGKAISGANYRNLEHTLKVLGGIQMSGNIFDKNQEFTGSLIEFSYTRDASGEIDRIVMAFGEKFRQHLQKDESVLTIPGEVLVSNNPLQIRLIEVARCHMGKKLKWEVGLTKLMNLCYEKRRSKYEFKRAVKKTHLPYSVEIRKSTSSKDEVVVFQPTADKKTLD
ncbi:MAG: replication initiator protein A [Cyanobacteria bacterium J06621_8]